ncbi:hypothetical protein [Kibdelosporangium phytohabitans]|uniref:Uncharacterized protein n=1 Tax=Kibdelosporangium phytohabitans TaxID=860235 RepID=A0A0N9HM54_9PSEU|nr:hypothetical protein [Kibdelosporangium phytohabitans]ALG07662.1 hypothetical protein AOZ06_12765 [Kibdelosporangium phytohabitans]ALG07718.1 hypothetical protein AOZ06_13085 [Kibdelosporangium phytohabitans]MBE1471378.1 hypothetical protein [Kibdelosporangium phytohabitans]
MPWYAEREDLPDAYRHHADAGSQLAAVYERLGYIEVPAPGTEVPDADPSADPVGPPQPEPVDEQPVAATAGKPKRGRSA